MPIEHVAVVGVGLIGGSFALALRRRGLAQRITGWGGARSLEVALSNGVIDGVEEAFDQGRQSSADLVYLAAPVRAIADFMKTRGKLLRPGATITDAGSTKREICRAAREHLPGTVSFVAGHPMAGSERTGVEFADADLFCGAPYAIVVEDADRDLSDAERQVTQLVKAIGAEPVVLTADEHDRIVARISHAPQLLSTALAAALARSGERDKAYDLAGSGLSDMTRLAESSWSVWEDICRTNADEISSALAYVVREVEASRRALAAGDFGALAELFRAANQSAAHLRQTTRKRSG